MANADDYDQVTVRIFKGDHRILLWRQANVAQSGARKPSLAELVHKAIEQTAASK